MMTLNMCWDRLLVELPSEEKKSASGLIIPDDAESIGDGSCIGTISAIGEEVDDKRFPVGTKIVYYSNNATPITINGKKYNIIEQRDIIGVAVENEKQ